MRFVLVKIDEKIELRIYDGANYRPYEITPQQLINLVADASHILADRCLLSRS